MNTRRTRSRMLSFGPATLTAMQTESPTLAEGLVEQSEAVVVRVTPETKRELVAIAKTNNRSVAGETRAALDVWLAVNRREQVKA